jgi:uncharacterized protein (DUF58 family)
MLDPQVLASIADLELVARVMVDGTVSGLHRSPFHGYSAEFSQYRHYRPGDDFKYVDWKLFARTDRVYTKQYRETTNMPVLVVMDASASMGFGEGASGRTGVGKFQYARVLASALAYLVAAQGDAVGLAVFDAGLREHVASRAGQPHLRRLLAALSRVSPSGATAAAAALRRAADLLKRRGLLIVFSDLYEEGDAVDSELRRAVRAGHEVALFHVLSREEIDFPYRGDIEFEDVESGQTVLTRAATVAPTYRAAMSAFVERWRSRCASYGIDYTSAVTDLPPDEVLRTYLLRRSSAAAR